MKTKTFFTVLIIGALSIFIFSCNENKPKSDQMRWSPDGKKLALVTTESKELLIIDVSDNLVNNITVVDKSENTTLASPQWSSQGDFLLYFKKGKEQTEIWTYSLNAGSKQLIQTMPKKDAQTFQHLAAWSLHENRLVYAKSESSKNTIQFISATADGQQKKALFELPGNPLWYELSPDGEWIAVSLKDDSNPKSAGIWKLKSDGSIREKIYGGESITCFSWSPDGSKLALVNQIRQPKDSTYIVILIDSDGKNEQIICNIEPGITRIDWSPKANFISLVQRGKEKSNIWVMESSSLMLTKITFDNLEDYFGWDSSEKLFFTVDYPEVIITASSAENEYVEFIETMSGVMRKNQLCHFEKNGINRVGKNIYSYHKSEVTNNAAYFIPYEIQFLSSNNYLPGIYFPGENYFLIPRTKTENIAAADIYYKQQNYDDALKQMSNYWKTDFYSLNFKTNFDVAKTLETMRATDDSTQVKKLVEGIKDGTLIRTVLILRQLNQNKNANWMFEQFKMLTKYFLQNPKYKSNKDDSMLWVFLETYLKYNSAESGIFDLDEILYICEGDSLEIATINFSQSILAFESNQKKLSIEKFQKSLTYVSKSSDMDDFISLISILLINSSNNSETYIPILQNLASQFSHDKNIQDIHEMLGDIYLKKGNSTQAFSAYQDAVISNFDQYKIWTKLFEIEEP